MAFPEERARRLRRSASMRDLVRETHLRPTDFMLPLFVMPGREIREEVSSMPGVFRTSVDGAVADARAAFEVGVRSLILFGIPASKDSEG